MNRPTICRPTGQRIGLCKCFRCRPPAPGATGDTTMSTQYQLIEQCTIRLRGIVEALDNIHDTSPQRWSTDLDDVHSSAESLLAMINDQASNQAALAQPSPKCTTCNGTGQIVVSGPHYCGELQPPECETEPCDMCSQPSPEQAERDAKPGLFCRDCGGRLGVRGVCNIYCPKCEKEAGRRDNSTADDGRKCSAADSAGVSAQQVCSDPAARLNACGPTEQPSPAQVECIDCHGSGFCMSISNEEIRCPCRAPIKFSGLAQAEQAEAERPEVVGVRYEDGTILSAEDCGTALEVCAKVQTPLMTVAQHERIVGELRFERQQMDRAFTACINERDAALANVDALAVQVLKLGGTISFAHHRTDQAGQVPQAWLDVQAERRRQVEDEGWTPEHDDEHNGGELADAAACYALSAAGWSTYAARERWPWPLEWWKPSTARRDLVKACALALAEIERLDRAGISQSPVGFT